MSDDCDDVRPKRQKRESSYRSKALEKFKQLKSRNKYEVEELENVYDTVDEKEYTKRVLDHQEDWIVDDDGSGYVEDGRDIFDDDLDRNSIAAAASSTSSKRKGSKRNKKGLSENASKGSLQFMISNMPNKKKEEEKLDNDEVLAELLKEIDTPPVAPLTPSLKRKRDAKDHSPWTKKKAENAYVRTLQSSVSKTPPARLITQINKKNPEVQTEKLEIERPQTSTNGSKSFVNKFVEPRIEEMSTNNVSPPPSPEEILQEKKREQEDVFNDDFDLSQIEDSFDSAEPTLKNVEIDMSEWISTNESNNVPEITIDLKNTDLPLVDREEKKVFRFFWWDAFEDPTTQPGVVFLFGKVYQETTKSYLSCCVAVRNIERRIYFLPKVAEGDSDKPVTAEDVYKEINNSVMKNMQIKKFKARLINKKYAFDREVPTESDYVEVRYSAKDPPISKDIKGKTFSRVFGIGSSYLEIFLLDRKIKGPCWLDVSNPIVVTNPISWCCYEIDCNKVSDLSIANDVRNKPPLVVAAINMRRVVNSRTGTNEIVMLSCAANMNYSVDKQAPTVPFQKHFCVFTSPSSLVLPLDLYSAMTKYKATTLQKVDSEKALLNYFINHLIKLDADVIVGHDLQGYLINILSERLVQHHVNNFSKLGRIKRSILVKQKLERGLFTGRLVCDIKISAKELIRCRSYDLESLCQTVLKITDCNYSDLEPDEVLSMFETSANVLRLTSLTMQETSYILKIMFNLNVLPLALQITNIAGNVMSKTLLGGRSERNEFLLLHAFSEKNYIVPDKEYKSQNLQKIKSAASRKKPTYAGGLVLDPKVGFYDKHILLMDFNSLYPSIIQEYNICFTTMPPTLSEDNMVIPDENSPRGVLPAEIRKLVESRREVKKLMKNPELPNDMMLHYHIRQMALKLTANSMYGCLGFSNSRFFAKNLAALITFKGREILTHTKDLVQRMNYDVIYGDTDSLMINTNIMDFDQVFQIGHKIKQEVNKIYKQVELDIDGVFKYLLLLKKKKYAAVTLTKGKDGNLISETEYKGLDIVRRDWSRLASEAGKFVLHQILNDQVLDDRVTNIFEHLRKIKEDLEAEKIPLSLLVITKQLTKNPDLYNDSNSLPHVQVALRYNKEFGGHFKAGDTVPYLICQDDTDKVSNKRAYHIEELKSKTHLKIDVKYYLSQQIYPVVSRICEPIEEVDIFQLAETLGVDSSTLKRNKTTEFTSEGENITDPTIKFRSANKFSFLCSNCNNLNEVDGPLYNKIPVLDKCQNPQCSARPVDYISDVVQQMEEEISSYISKYYTNEFSCEDPNCGQRTTRVPTRIYNMHATCNLCNATLLKDYSASDLQIQLEYFHYMFNLSKLTKKPVMEYKVEKAYEEMEVCINEKLNQSRYSVVSMSKILEAFSLKPKPCNKVSDQDVGESVYNEGDEDLE